MLKAKSLLFSLLMLIICSVNIFSQDQWQPPKPLEIKVFDAMVGEWEGVAEMMGMKSNETLKIYWTLNKQFLVTEVKSVGIDKPEMIYNGIGYFSVDKAGNVKSWWFDEWGTDMAMTGTGTLSDTKFTSVSTNSMMKDDRTFEINGNELTMTGISTWMQDGKEMKMDDKTVFKRK